MTKRIAVAIGDPNGIGPEIAVKAATAGRADGVEPVLVGDAFVIDHYASPLGVGKALATAPVASLDAAAFNPGALDPRAGCATVDYVSEAVRMAVRGEVAAVIACPMSETAINRAGIAFSGYPGLVADLTGAPPERTFLMLIASGLRVAHVTLHESVRAALARMTPELVVSAGCAAVDTARRLGIAEPRLGVFGINPHAGEEGLFGEEDERITKPAVERLRALGVAADGPAGADVMLSQRRHDLYLAMFHDQGHIPVKLLSPLRASALTIGTPVLFSSVAHGCAFDIAGRGVADPTALIETLALLGRVGD